jgi:hypothetical protein
MTKRYCFAAALLLILFSEMSCESTPAISDELTGVWRTQALGHRDTFFELKKDQISFGTAVGEVFPHAITKVDRKKDQRKGWILYKVYYLNESAQTYEFSFYYQPSGQGKIFFKNKPSEVWSKDQL